MQRYWTDSVAWRMRFAMLAVCTLIVVSAVASIIGLLNIRSVEGALLERSVPQLEQIERMNDQLQTLKRVFGSLSDIDNKTTLRERLARIRTAIQQLKANDIQRGEFPQMLDALGGYGRSIGDAATARLNRLSDVEQRRGTADVQKNALQRIVETFVADIGGQLELRISDPENPIQPVQLQQHISALNALSQLGFVAQESGDITRLMRVVTSKIEMGELEERLAFKLRSAVLSLRQISDPDQRKQIAAAFRDVRRQLLGDDGLVVRERQLLEAETDFQTILTDLKGVVDLLSVQVTSGVSGARDDVRQTAEGLQDAVVSTIFGLVVLSIVVLAVAVAVSVLLVERQIVGRLNRLSQAVREIAGGNIEREVEVDGQDEFGEMANALEAFKANSKELRRSNAELARFAYAASHDLRSPLRAIRDLAVWTIEDAGDSLPEDCRENLDLLLSRVDRLSRLLGNLLEYSRVGREEASVKVIDPAEMLLELTDLLDLDGKFSVEVVGDLTPVRTPEAPLRQILLNLITNAVKHHDRGEGHLDVKFQRQGSRMVISVADDGPGIDPEYHDRIFGLFETLQSRDNVEGSGMGLAIIQKQIEWYDGSVTVSSDPAITRGTTFAFDWPVEFVQQKALEAA